MSGSLVPLPLLAIFFSLNVLLLFKKSCSLGVIFMSFSVAKSAYQKSSLVKCLGFVDYRAMSNTKRNNRTQA